MADNEDGEEKTFRGNEWEVVSLTASAYAAAPGPREVELKDDDKGNAYEQNEAETSHALFMSRHFVFPPSQHENLPLEPDYSVIHDESGDRDVISEVTIKEGTRPSGKDEGNWNIAGLNISEEFLGMQYFDEKLNMLSVHGKQFDEGTTVQGFGLIDNEESMDSPSFHSETALDGTTAYGENIVVPETTEPAEQGLNASAGLFQSKNFPKDDNYTPSDVPCVAWWKRRAVSLYVHAKEANAFWSVFIAAAVMGLVMLGQRWQQEKALELKWQNIANDEARSRILGSLFRLKDVVVGGHRRGSLIRSCTSGQS